MRSLDIDLAELSAYSVCHHDSNIVLLTTAPAERNFDAALAPTVASVLLRIRSGNVMRLYIRLLHLAYAYVIVAVVFNDLDVVLVVT